jgi:hypothetical protein
LGDCILGRARGQGAAYGSVLQVGPNSALCTGMSSRIDSLRSLEGPRFPPGSRRAAAV